MSQSGDAPNTLTLHYRNLYGIIFVCFRFRFSIASAQSIPFVSYTYVDVLYSHQHITRPKDFAEEHLVRIW